MTRRSVLAASLMGVGVLTATLLAILTIRPDPSGIVATDRIVGTLMAAARAILMLAAVGAVGTAVLPLLLRRAPLGRSVAIIRRARQWGVAAGLVWAVAAGASLLLLTVTVADTIGAVPEVVGAFPIAKGLLLTMVCAGLFAGLTAWAAHDSRRVSPELLVGVVLLGLVPLPLTGHRAPGGWQEVAVFVVELHVLAAALWVGGLAALALFTAHDRAVLAAALPTFSVMAATCLGLVAVSGIVNGTMELTAVGASWTGAYGILLLIKAISLLAIGTLALVVRRRIIPTLAENRAVFVRWVSLELLVMAVALGTAVVLTRTPAT